MGIVATRVLSADPIYLRAREEITLAPKSVALAKAGAQGKRLKSIE